MKNSSAVSHVALVLAFTIALILFVDYHYLRWRDLQHMPSLVGASPGEGLVVRNNGLGYYAWLRSLLVDHDWDFANEFDEHSAGSYVPPKTYVTPVGRRANQWSIGPACAWSLAVVPVHYGLRLWNSWRCIWPADGYSLPYQLAVGGATLAVSGAGLWLIYALCCVVAQPRRAGVAAVAIFLGSTIIYYGSVDVSMAHGLGATAVAWLAYYWLSTYGSTEARRWAAVGVFSGFAALMRWQLTTLLLLPAGEALFFMIRSSPRLGLSQTSSPGRVARLRSGTFLLCHVCAGFFVGFLPQMIAWRIVYGSWLVAPIRGLSWNWLKPALREVLFSQNRSLFYWTPITLIAIVSGLWAIMTAWRAKFRLPFEPVAILLIAFLVQVYFLSSVWGRGHSVSETGLSAGVYMSISFGFRHLNETVVLLAPGLALALQTAGARSFRLLSLALIALVTWNLQLVVQYYYGQLPAEEGVEPRTFLRNFWLLAQKEPFLLALVALELPALLWAFLFGWPDSDSRPAGEPKCA
jgi:hypothetical protein